MLFPESNCSGSNTVRLSFANDRVQKMLSLGPPSFHCLSSQGKYTPVCCIARSVNWRFQLSENNSSEWLIYSNVQYSHLLSRIVGLLYCHIISSVKIAHVENNMQRHALVIIICRAEQKMETAA